MGRMAVLKNDKRFICRAADYLHSL